MIVHISAKMFHNSMVLVMLKRYHSFQVQILASLKATTLHAKLFHKIASSISKIIFQKVVDKFIKDNKHVQDNFPEGS